MASFLVDNYVDVRYRDCTNQSIISLFFNKTLDILLHKVYSYYSHKDNTDIKKGQKDVSNFSQKRNTKYTDYK